MSEGWPTPPRSPRDDGTVSTKHARRDNRVVGPRVLKMTRTAGDDTHGMVFEDRRRSWADATAPRVTYGPEGLDDYLGSTLTYSQVPPRANAAVKVVTVLTNVNASEFRKELAFRFRKNAMRYFTKY